MSVCVGNTLFFFMREIARADEKEIFVGETMESIAERFGTTVEHLLALNQNLITNVHNPRYIYIYIYIYIYNTQKNL